MSDPLEEAPVYEALRAYVVDGVPLGRSALLEFATDGKPLLVELGRSGINLAEPEAAKRFTQLWNFMDKHGGRVVNTDSKTLKQYKKLYG